MLLVVLRVAAFHREAHQGTELYHFHIPKTAGRSFREDLLDIYPAGRERIVSKEECFVYGAEHGVGRIATMVRNPMAHVLSQHRHCTASGRHDRGWGLDWEPTLENWLAYNLKLRESGVTRVLGKLMDCLNPMDLHSHRWTCNTTWDQALHVDTDLAIRNMHATWFVGVRELYQESLCLFYVKVRGRLPQKCHCGNMTAWTNFSTHFVTTHYNVHSPRYSSWSDRARGLAEQLTKSDTQLYKAALRRFLGELRWVEIRFGRRVLCRDPPAT